MSEETEWLPAVRKGDGPVYLAIADALAEDVATGRLAVGTRLPPQRLLALRLGLDFTTVSRAYAEAQRRGLVVGQVGRGTFVAPQERVVARRTERPGRMIDMAMNAPPIPSDPVLLHRMRSGMAEVARQFPAERLFGYGETAGAADDRAAGVSWLSGRIDGSVVDRLLICPGVQAALLAILPLVAREGDVVCTEALTYPGMKALAAQLGIRLHGVPMDGEGIDPAALRAACQTLRPKALYCNPTLHNPTARTMTLERRLAVVAVAREFNIPIIEDDAYGLLAPKAPPPIAKLAPDVTFYVAGLAKTLSPALRIAYLVTPPGGEAARVAAALRATSLTASSLSAALATQWITDGTAAAVLAAIRTEAAARQCLARELLPAGCFEPNPEAFHLWLHLSRGWSRAEFAAHLGNRGIAVAGGDAFAVTEAPPEAVRLCLGTLRDQVETKAALQSVAELLRQSPAIASAVI